MSRPARRPSRIRPPHRGRTPSVSSANRSTREVQPFVRPVPPRTRGHRSIPIIDPSGKGWRKLFQEWIEHLKEWREPLLVVLALIIALVFVQMNSNLIAH